MELSQTRRGFLGSLGALYATRLLPPDLEARTDFPLFARPSLRRGIAPGPDDFAFAPGLIYLQTGSLGPTPRPVMERAIAAWRELQLDPVRYGYGEHEHAMDGVRAQAASLIGSTTDEVVLTRSTTEGMNWVAQGLSFGAGDRILTTDQEHPGGTSCWRYVARRFGVALDVVPITRDEHDAGAIIDRVAKAITPSTRVFSFSHVLTSTGLHMPVPELCALARSRGIISVVDGAQSLGGRPVDVKTLGCHAFAAPGHKWLLAPPGTGILYLSQELGTTIDPIALQAGHNAYSESSGVTGIPAVLGMGAAIEYITAIGTSEINRHNLALRDRLYSALRNVPRLRVVSAPPGPLTSALLTFWLPDDYESGAFRARIREKHNIQLKVVPKNWFNGIRVSTHLFNSEQEVDALVAALRIELA